MGEEEKQQIAAFGFSIIGKLVSGLIGATLRNELQSLSIDEEHGWLTPLRIRIADYPRD